jgi:hypothetical protein
VALKWAFGPLNMGRLETGDFVLGLTISREIMERRLGRIRASIAEDTFKGVSGLQPKALKTFLRDSALK